MFTYQLWNALIFIDNFNDMKETTNQPHYLPMTTKVKRENKNGSFGLFPTVIKTLAEIECSFGCDE